METWLDTLKTMAQQELASICAVEHICAITDNPVLRRERDAIRDRARVLGEIHTFLRNHGRAA